MLNWLKAVINKRDMARYFFAGAMLVGMLCAVAIFYDISHIHVYRHDSLYYWTQKGYLGKVASEGRWLNYLLYPIVTKVPGIVWSVFVLLAFAGYMFAVFHAWSKSFYYALLSALLFMQIPPFFAMIQWPATAAPSLMVLLLSLFFLKRLSVFVYFLLFGVLFFGSFSNLYYLLPLAYLGRLSAEGVPITSKTVLYRLIPAWAAGFFVGYGVANIVTFFYVGHYIELAQWRHPHYVKSWSDLVGNASSSLYSFERYIHSIFSTPWITGGYLFAAVAAIYRRKMTNLMWTSLVVMAILLVHFIVVIPSGIVVSPRTIIATWVGVLALVLFIPSVSKRQMVVLVPLMIVMTYSLYRQNHMNMQWYATLTNLYYDALVKESPLPPGMYEKGIVFIGSDKEMKKRNRWIERAFAVHNNGALEGLGSIVRWAPAAREAGYKRVIVCHKNGKHKGICSKIVKKIIRIEKKITSPRRFYKIAGEYEGWLVISLSQNTNKARGL